MNRNAVYKGKKVVCHGFFECFDQQIGAPVAVVEFDNGNVSTVDADNIIFERPTDTKELAATVAAGKPSAMQQLKQAIALLERAKRCESIPAVLFRDISDFLKPATACV
jgi:hypothetical protein